MITLFHGSNVDISRIDLTLSRPGKDFGCGFYLNADRKQAEAMALRTCRRIMSGVPTVSAFSFDESILSPGGELMVKIFDGYSEEWAEFILKNRRNFSHQQVHPFDIVVGPIADDTVSVQIRRFIQGYIDIERLISELKYRGDNAIQYFFGSERAVSFLSKIENGV